jgi:acetoacetyl-CoA synthetase
MERPLWQPSEERIARAELTAFMARMADRHGAELREFSRFRAWAAESPELFWPAVWEMGEVRASRSWDRVLADGDRMPGARWFEGARLNFAENLLRLDGDGPAIIAWREGGPRRELSWRELHERVGGLAQALALDGVGPGDRVAGYLPNIPETVVGHLAAASLGAVWSSCSPDFGVQGVLDRFGQIEPKVLIGVDGYRYAGKAIDMRARLAEVRARLPGLRRVVVVPFLAERPDLSGIPDSVALESYCKPPTTVDVAQMPFDHPLAVLYSSGTTGMPKAIVHGAGGTLLQHIKEHRLHTDVKAGDRLFYFTTCGWMMWNWLVGGLASGATIVLYDGSPFHPDGRILWDMAEAEGVTHFGTSAKYIDALRKAEVIPARSHDLSRLRAVMSTGSPLVAESFDWVYEAIKDDLHLASISGGTDIVSCFVLGNPIAPVWRGEIQTRGLGMAVEIWDDDGKPVVEQKGELVCTRPFPCMPVAFWNDPDGKRYRSAYFERFPGVWHHGDYAELTRHDGIVIYGRSDAVLNPGGVRIGTAEIYRQVEQIEEVLESICVGQEWDDDVRVVLFVRLRDGVTLDADLERRIRARIREGASPRHVPARIVQVGDIPRTLSGKIVELAVREVIHGRPVGNTDALANPEALEQFRDRVELQR